MFEECVIFLSKNRIDHGRRHLRKLDPPAIVVAIHAVPRGTIVRASDIQLQRVSAETPVTGSFQSAVPGDESIKAEAKDQRQGETVTTSAMCRGRIDPRALQFGGVPAATPAAVPGRYFFSCGGTSQCKKRR